MCDQRNQAQVGHDHVHEYPIFGILYGKSDCGKSELVDTLQRSMFGRHGTTQKDWFTTNRIAYLMAENRRYPLVFDDLGRDRYSKYAVVLIKEDHVRLAEYPVVVILDERRSGSLRDRGTQAFLRRLHGYLPPRRRRRRPER